MSDRSKVIPSEAYRWRGIGVKQYRADDAPCKDVTRQTLLGEGDDETDLSFLTRYFEIQPNGYSTLERHRHPHAVVIIRGRGRVQLGERTYEVAPHDCVYIAPGAFHQFHAAADEPLGFLCMVDRVRDRPQLPTEEERRALDRKRGKTSR